MAFHEERLPARLSGEAVDLIAAVLRRGGLEEDEFTAGALDGEAAGYVIDRPMRTRDALEPLLAAFGATAAERDGRVAVSGAEAAAVTLTAEALALPDEGTSLAAERSLEPRPKVARVRFIDETADYQTGSVVVRAEHGGKGGGLDADLPVVCDAELATSMARRALALGGEGERLTVRLGPLEALRLEPGDGVEVEGRAGDWCVAQLDWDEQPTATLEPVVRVGASEAMPDWRPGEPPTIIGAPFLQLLDLPILPGAKDDGRPVAVVAAEPWRLMTLHGGQDAATLTPRASVTQPATVGGLTEPLTRGVLGRWDETNAITVQIEGAAAMLWRSRRRRVGR